MALHKRYSHFTLGHYLDSSLTTIPSSFLPHAYLFRPHATMVIDQNHSRA